MQRVRRFVAGGVAALTLATATVATPREQDGPRTPQPREIQQKPQAQKAPKKGLIARIFDYIDNNLENKVSLPPG